MKTTLIKAAAVAALAAGVALPASAGVLTYQGVTFTSSWTGNTLTLEIDAANPEGDWAGATSIGALQLKDIGSFSDVTLTAAPAGAMDWTMSSHELNAKGCGGGGHAGRGACFSGTRVALTDDMVFQFTFSGGAPHLDAPHLKVNFFGERDAKLGSLLSQTIAPVPEPGTYAMLGGGLALLGWLTRRRKGVDKV